MTPALRHVIYGSRRVSPEAAQFLDRIPANDPDRAAFRGMIDFFVAQNKWRLIESLYIRACANKATSLENVKSASHRGIQVGLADGAFTPYIGWTGDGNPLHFINNNQNPSINPGILSQDDCGYGEYISAGSWAGNGGINTLGGNANLYIQGYSDGLLYHRPQAAGDLSLARPATPLGLWFTTRTGVNAGALYRDDVLIASDAGGDVAFKNQDFTSLSLASTDGSSLTTKATLVTRGLTAGDAAVFRAGIDAFFP